MGWREQRNQGRWNIGLKQLGALERMEDVGIWGVGTDQKLLHVH